MTRAEALSSVPVITVSSIMCPAHTVQLLIMHTCPQKHQVIQRNQVKRGCWKTFSFPSITRLFWNHHMHSVNSPSLYFFIRGWHILFELAIGELFGQSLWTNGRAGGQDLRVFVNCAHAATMRDSAYHIMYQAMTNQWFSYLFVRVRELWLTLQSCICSGNWAELGITHL